MPRKTIEQVLKEHTPEIMSVSGVVGTAQGLCDDAPCIKVYVAELTPELEKMLPDEIDGYMVKIEETGEFKARPEK